MRTLLLLLMCCLVSSAVNHSLEYIITESYGIKDFPKLVAVAQLNGVTFLSCDGKTIDPKHDWVRKMFAKDAGQRRHYTEHCLNPRQYLREDIDTIMQRLNQTGGKHVSQMTIGCGWDDKTDKTDWFQRFGYDGEDFVAFDLEKLKWTAPTSKASTTEYSWNKDWIWLKQNENFLSHLCPQWIQKYLRYRRKFTKQTGNTSVSILQKSPSSPVRCFATGFYPNRAVMFWRKEGKRLDKDVKHGEILPNHDETFQMSVNLSISSVTPEEWRKYECVFQLHGVKEDIITKLDEALIRESPSGFSVAAVAVTLGLVLLCVCILRLLISKRRNNGFQPANRGQEQSEDTAEVH